MDKRASFVLAVSLLGIVAASVGCSSSTNTTTPSPNTAGGAQAAALNAYFSANDRVVDNFTVASAIYAGAFQDHNGTLHLTTLYVVKTSGQAKGEFEAQKASYADRAAAPNATVTVNSSTHWSVTNGAGLGGQTLILLELSPTGIYTDIGNQTTNTDINGFYSFNVTQGTPGTYAYIIGYSGNTTYTVGDVAVLVTFQTLPTTVMAIANTAEQTVGHSVQISGTLTSRAGLSGKPATLYQYNGAFWISNASAQTDSSGNFSFLITQNSTGAFDYRVGFAGDNTYAATTSARLSILYEA